jgi:hypothetical protein
MIASLDEALTLWQFVRHIGENVLVLGLIIELFALIFLDDKSKSLERKASIMGTIVVVLGLVVENRAGERQDEMVRKMREPRHLTEVQQKELGSLIGRFGRHEAVFFQISDIDPEVNGLMTDLSRGFGWYSQWKSGIDRWPPLAPEPLFRNPDKGILVWTSSAANQEVLNAADAVTDFLKKHELECRTSHAFTGPYPRKDDRMFVIVYGK